MDTPITGGIGLLDIVIRNLRAIFPDSLLIPVPRGVDPRDVPLPLLTEVDTPAFQSRLATQNIAVVLGQRDGLLALRFEREAAMEEFLTWNPSCRASLITMHDCRPVVWLRTRTAHQVSLLLPDLSVLMQGAILVLSRDGLERTDLMVNQAAPLLVNLASINWGPDADGAIDSWLTRLSHGRFFQKNARGQDIPKRPAWCHYLTRRLRTHLVYDPDECQFFEPTSAGDWLPVPQDELRLRLRGLISMAPVDAPEAKARLSDEWLGQVCCKLKASLEAHLPLVEGRLRVFLDQVLVKEPRANVTNGELAEAFADDCWVTGQPLLSPKRFKVLVGRILREEPWLVCYSKSIRRPGGQQNGWRGVRLKAANTTNPTLGGADGADGAKF
jgi:hypothetical protein